MRPRSLIVLFVTLAMLAISCTPDGGVNTTAAEDGATTSVSGEGEVDLREFQFGYMESYLLVPVDQAEETLAILADREVDVTETDLSELLPELEGEGDEIEEYSQAREMLDSMLRVFTVPQGDDDALDVALMVREGNADLDASPVHAIGEAGHVSWAPGNEAMPVPGDSMPPIPNARDEIYAAVVDSGIYPDAPGLNGNVVSRPSDLEPGGGDGHSHGTFVSGIIRHLAPDHHITFARPRSVDVAAFTWVDHAGEHQQASGPTRQALTSELHVAEAILRIVHRHQQDPERVRSLNLSVGAYSPLPTDDPALISVVRALERWFDAFPEAPVFAAGGNDPVIDPVLPFWPAALSMQMSGVRAIGALSDPTNGDPEEIVWDNGAEKVWADYNVGPRDWITALAPGSLLVNHTGVTTVAAWSGSSFATAVANALHLRREDPIPPRRVDIEGLVYWDGSQVQP